MELYHDELLSFFASNFNLRRYSAAETLDNYKVTCGIINGRKYTINLSAQGHRPALKFSFHSFDFGRPR